MVRACFAWLFAIYIGACHRTDFARGPDSALQPSISGASLAQGATCKGDAPLPAQVAKLPGARASWVPDATDGALLFVLELGPRITKEPPLVIFHGIGKHGIDDYYSVFEALSRSRRVIALDLPGFGRSGNHSEDLGPERIVRSMVGVLEACGVGEADVLGHSSGAPLALLFTSEHGPRVRRLIVVSPMGILRPEVLLHAQLSAQLAGMHEKVPRAARAVQTIGDVAVQLMRVMTTSGQELVDSGLIGHSPGVLLAASLLDYNFGQAIANVKTPTLILIGKLDKVVPARIAHLLDENLPRSQEEFVADAGHVIMEDQPQQFVASVDRFLTQPLDLDALRPTPVTDSAQGVEAVCRKQEYLVIRGHYDRVLLEDCHHVWFDHVSAGQITLRNSEASFDAVHVTDGVTLDASKAVFTAGELRGKIALDLSTSKVDIAGTKLTGSEMAIFARKESKLVLSVTPVESPNTQRIVHRTFELHTGSSR